MNIGIVGLGLIGGSMAKAYKKAGATVLGCDSDGATTGFARLSETIDGELDEEHFSKCDLIMICIPPVEAEHWLEENAPKLSEHTLVIDCCGTKRTICEAGFRLAKQYGFTYAGGHPMAGTQFAGFKNSDENMFQGKTFVLVPEDRNDMFFIDRVKQMIFPAGFAKLVISSAEQHDKVIAFTSQMAHVVSNAFIKSETAFDRGAGMSAGSYRDLTRVAGLDANMWTELFMENRDNLKHEIDTLINELKKYEKALEEEDEDTMRSLLAEGSRRKFEVESRCG